MSLLIEAQSLPALIIKPRLILVAHTDDLGWNKTSNQQRQMLIQNLNRIVSRPNAIPGQIMYYNTNCIPIDLMFKENFPINTQVWNSLSHRNDCQQRGLSELRMGATTATRTRSETSVNRRSIKCATTCMGRADNELIATRHSCEVKGCNTMTIRGGRTQPLG